jgi:hypothetical protein
MNPFPKENGTVLYFLELSETKVARLKALAEAARNETRVEYFIQRMWDLLDFLAQEGIA